MTAPLRFDQVVIVCRICKHEHTLYPDRPLTAAEVKPYLDTHARKYCNADCPADKCDVKLRMRCPTCPHPMHAQPCCHCGCKDVSHV